MGGGIADVLDYKTSAMSFSLFVKTPVAVTMALLALVTLGDTIQIGLLILILVTQYK